MDQTIDGSRKINQRLKYESRDMSRLKGCIGIVSFNALFHWPVFDAIIWSE